MALPPIPTSLGLAAFYSWSFLKSAAQLALSLQNFKTQDAIKEAGRQPNSAPDITTCDAAPWDNDGR